MRRRVRWPRVRSFKTGGHRVLREDGSLYLHCDPTASHYIKAMLDAVFGKKNFRNEIVWHYRRWTAGNKNFQKMHDILLRYAKSENFVFNLQYEPYGEWIKSDYRYVDEETGKRWRWHTVKGRRYKVYLEDEDRGVKLNDVWQIPYLGSTAKERTGYPTQKPLALLERIIAASSNPGDVVFDPFCGCATTLIAAESLKRNWIGSDIWDQASEQVLVRLYKLGLNPNSAEAKLSLKALADHLGIQQASDFGKGGRDKTVHDRFQRVGATRESLAAQQLNLLANSRNVHLISDLPLRTDDGAIAAPYLASQWRSKHVTPGAEDASFHWPNAKKKVYLVKETGGNICWGCGRDFDHAAYLELDHINPRAGGGANSVYNRALLCGPCNGRKGARLTLVELRKQNKRDGFMVSEIEIPSIPIIQSS